MVAHKGYALVLAEFNNAAEGYARTADAIENWNGDIVRISMYPQDVEASLLDFRESLEGSLEAFEGALQAAEDLGKQLILCVHNFWGNKYKGPNNEEGRFHKKKYSKEFIKMWRRLAIRYRDDSRIFAFEIANEPEPGNGHHNKWNKLAQKCCRVIRKKDSNRALIVPCVAVDPRNFNTLKPIRKVSRALMQNVYYAVHIYNPMVTTHPWLSNGPTIYPDPDHDLTKIKVRRRFLKAVRKFKDEHGVRLVCTEFGVAHTSGYPNNDNRIAWTDDIIELMEQYLKVDVWTYFTLDPHSPHKPSKPFLPCSGGVSQIWCMTEQRDLEDENNEFSQFIKQKVAQ